MYFQKILFLALSFLIIAGSSASGNEILLERPFKGVRAMGMANAFGAVADDGDAFYYNPAGLTNAKKIRVDFQPIGVIMTQNLKDEIENIDKLIDDIQALNKSSNPLEDPELEDERQNIVNRMEALTRDEIGLDTMTPLRLIVPLNAGNYAIAIGAMAHTWSQSQIYVRKIGLKWDDFAKDVLNDELYYNIIAEASYGLAAALEFPIYSLPLEISSGVSIRRMNRWQLTNKTDPLTIDSLIQMDEDDFNRRFFDPDDPMENIVKSTGYRIDLGAIGTFRDFLSLGAVFQNVPGKVAKESLPLNSQVSASINLAKIPVPNITSLDIILAGTLDIGKDANKDEDLINRGQFGVEVIWKLPFLALSGRMGSNHGFMTLGAGIQLFFLDFDYAFYGDFDADWHAFSLNMAF